MKIIIIISLILNLIFANNINNELHKKVNQKKIKNIPISKNLLSTDNGGSLSAIEAYSDGVGLFISDSSINNSLMNDYVYKYGEEAQKEDLTLKEYLDNNNITEDAYNIPIIENEVFKVGDPCNDLNEETINDKYIDIKGTCKGEYIVGNTCNDYNINTYDDIYVNKKGDCFGKLYNNLITNVYYENGYSLEYIGTVEDYMNSIVIPYIGTVEDYMNSEVVTYTGTVLDTMNSIVIPYTGSVVDNMNSTTTTYTGSVIDSMNSTSTSYTGSVVDSMNSTSTTYTGSVVDSANSTITTYTGSVIDSMNSTSTSYTGSVVDSMNSTSTTYTGSVIDSMNSTSTTYTGSVIDYVSKTGSVDVVNQTSSAKYVYEVHFLPPLFVGYGNQIFVNPAPLQTTNVNSILGCANGSTSCAGITIVQGQPNGSIYVQRIWNTDSPSGGWEIKVYKVTTSSCPSGYTLRADGKCEKSTLTCPTGYTDNGTNCKKTVNYNYYKYNCPTGYAPTNAGLTTYTKTDPSNTTNNTTTLDDPVNSATAPAGNCKKTVNYNYYKYNCPTGYAPTNAGLTTYTKTDPSNTTDNTTTLATAVNSATAPAGNCKKTVNYNYYKYNCPTGYAPTNAGLTTYTKTDPSNTTDNTTTLATAVNNATGPVGNCKKTINYNYYKYNCPTGYTATEAGHSTYTKTDPSNTNDNTTTLDDPVNSATAPAGNCKKTINYNYYKYNCPTGYTATEAGYSTYTKTDPSSSTNNETTLTTAVNNATGPVGNCKKTINYNYYKYNCSTGYTATEAGHSTYTKTDPSNTTDNTTTLATAVNSATAPAGNCKKTINYNYYKYNCPTGYTATEAGYSTYTKTDPNTSIDNTLTLDDPINTEIAPVGNCKKTINYNYYKYNCPTGYTATEIGYSTYTKTDPNSTLNNEIELAIAVNSATSPAGNCKKEITYNYYGYTCPTGYTTLNQGYTTYTKTDPSSILNNEIELATTVNSATSPAGNCKKEINYSYYGYTCPNGYTITNQGYSTYTKTDPDNTKNNTDILEISANNQTSPIGNCKKNINYNYYEYKCISENYIPINKGYITYLKNDPNIEIINLDLETNVNNENSPINNCFINQEECPENTFFDGIGCREH